MAENIHRNSILYQSIVPARESEALQAEARRLALRLAKGLDMVGTLAVELFVTEDGELFVNELAPRLIIRAIIRLKPVKRRNLNSTFARFADCRSGQRRCIVQSLWRIFLANSSKAR